MDVKLWPLQIWYTIRHCCFLETVLVVTTILATLYWHIDECTSVNTAGCGCCLELLILVSAKWYSLSDSISLGCVSTNLAYVWQAWRFQSHWQCVQIHVPKVKKGASLVKPSIKWPRKVCSFVTVTYQVIKESSSTRLILTWLVQLHVYWNEQLFWHRPSSIGKGVGSSEWNIRYTSSLFWDLLFWVKKLVETCLMFWLKNVLVSEAWEQFKSTNNIYMWRNPAVLQSLAWQINYSTRPCQKSVMLKEWVSKSKAS